jgi:glucose-6-phosphate isomerase
MVEKNVKSWENLRQHFQNDIRSLHLRNLLQDNERNAQLQAKFEDILFDYSHEKLTPKTVTLFEELVKESDLLGKIHQLFAGVNFPCLS